MPTVRTSSQTKSSANSRGHESRIDAGSLKSLHVVAGLNPSDGGPYYTVPRLCRALAAEGVTPMLLSVAREDEGPSDNFADGYCDRRFPWSFSRVPIMRALRYSSGLSYALREAASGVDVIHGHGIWLMPNVQAGRVAAQAKKTLVVTPLGMLGKAALAFSRKRKFLFWHLLQRSAVRQAACIHATCEQEYEEVRAFGLTNRVAIIPNGIDLPEIWNAPTTLRSGERIVLSLGRVHPKKGLDRLLLAWAQVEVGYPEWRLRIVGPSELGHDLELRALAARLGLRRVSIEKAVYGDAKNVEYRNADLFVLPTLNENFGMTVAEALAAGTPVISTKGAPWRGLDAQGCGWWIDQGVEPLARALTNAMAMPREALKAMGAKGRVWMMQEFSWDRVGRDMLDVYCWLTRGAEAPPSVRFD